MNVSESASAINVVLVEDQASVRDTLRILLNGTPGFACAGTFKDGESALAKIKELRPDVVLMDINLPGMSGIRCTRGVKELLPDCHVVMLTVEEDDVDIFNALKAGASGYLLKLTSPAEILASISQVVGGGAPMSNTIARKVIQTFHPIGTGAVEMLTDRESEILKHLAQGYLYKEIAENLGISVETVHTHLRNVYRKLHVRSRTEAVKKILGKSEDSGIPLTRTG